MSSGGSSSGGGSNYDKAYNARMAKIAERQQSMADEMMGYYRSHGLPLDVATSEAQLELLPQQTAARSQFLDRSLQGVDSQRWASEAAGDVAQGFGQARQTMQRQAGRMGLAPNSERMMRGLSNMATDEALHTTSSQTQARRFADDESYRRLGAASGLGGM